MGYLACEVTLGGTLGPRSCDRQQGWVGVCSVNEEAPQPTPPVARWRTTSWKGLELGEARANELGQEGLGHTRHVGCRIMLDSTGVWY